MNKPNTLLKVVSILYIIVGALGIVMALLVGLLGGAVLGSLGESLGLGIAVGGILIVLLIGGSVLDLAAGILGVKGKYGGCKVLGIILLVFAVISTLLNISRYDSVGSIIVSIVTGLILPVLYTIGAFKQPKQVPPSAPTYPQQ